MNAVYIHNTRVIVDKLGRVCFNILCKHFQFNTSVQYTSKQMKNHEIHQEGIKKALKDIITEIEEKGDLCFPSKKSVSVNYNVNHCTTKIVQSIMHFFNVYFRTIITHRSLITQFKNLNQKIQRGKIEN